MTKREYLAALAWEQAALRPIFNAIMCQTGGLRRQDWALLRQQARALTDPQPAVSPKS